MRWSRSKRETAASFTDQVADGTIAGPDWKAVIQIRWHLRDSTPSFIYTQLMCICIQSSENISLEFNTCMNI